MPPSPTPISRRGFLTGVAGAAAAITVAGAASAAHASESSLAPSNAALLHPPPDPTWGGLTYDQPQLTDTNALFTAQYREQAPPQLDREAYRLVITGLGAERLALSLAQLRELPTTELVTTLACIGNKADGALVGNICVRGVAFTDLFAAYGTPSTRSARFTAADGYGTAVDLVWLLRHDALLAFELNGQALTPERGAPLRVILPPLYGMKQPRWITRVDFIDGAYFGYWEGRGYSLDGVIKTASQIRTLQTGSTMQAGSTVMLQGIAYTGVAGIVSVELQIDGGAWFPATLIAPESGSGWTQWHHRWLVPAPGAYAIRVRATDTDGFTQQATITERSYDGSSAIHAITCYAV